MSADLNCFLPTPDKIEGKSLLKAGLRRQNPIEACCSKTNLVQPSNIKWPQNWPEAKERRIFPKITSSLYISFQFPLLMVKGILDFEPFSKRRKVCQSILRVSVCLHVRSVEEGKFADRWGMIERMPFVWIRLILYLRFPICLLSWQRTLVLLMANGSVFTSHSSKNIFFPVPLENEKKDRKNRCFQYLIIDKVLLVSTRKAKFKI